MVPFFTSHHGALFAADCMAILPTIADQVIDTVFADPPFNLGKEYGGSTDDLQPDGAYLNWCRRWLAECVRVLKPSGSLFVYNLPRWNILLGAHLTGLGMDFRHWIAVEMSACLPIAGRLHPSHYSLLYYSKGKPKTFRRIRTPVQTCRHCGGEVKDYGGHRGALNPNGITLKDVWTDIPPVRHWKFKSRNRKANALFDEAPRSRRRDVRPSRGTSSSTHSAAAARPSASASRSTDGGSGSRSISRRRSSSGWEAMRFTSIRTTTSSRADRRCNQGASSLDRRKTAGETLKNWASASM